jgi:phosphopantothenoylcysteine decarboxylase/phosphopantothenate--cysteine ligase
VKFVVTAGPTREPLDPVRFLSNRSSGKMGYAIARAALENKHAVTLISGPVALEAPPEARLLRVTTGEEMFFAARAEFADCDVFVMCAAVCDYKPARYAAEKMPKERHPFLLPLVPARDILASLTTGPHTCFVVGFAAETGALRAHATRKLEEKKCDLMVANDVSRTDLGMDAEENELVIFSKNGAEQKLARGKKIELARQLLKIILIEREKCLTKKV